MVDHLSVMRVFFVGGGDLNNIDDPRNAPKDKDNMIYYFCFAIAIYQNYLQTFRRS